MKIVRTNLSTARASFFVVEIGLGWRRLVLLLLQLEFALPPLLSLSHAALVCRLLLSPALGCLL